MAIATRIIEGVTILDVKRRILTGPGTQEIQSAVRAALQSGDEKILLNMADVIIIDSDCVGELVGAFVSAKNQGVQLKLLNLTKNVNQVMNTTKLLTVFETFDDESTALKSFSESD
ncbi:STAS domain-containing protein [Acidobacteria bacterium AH-259-D05]|nr:STAS domain-containing protein [Acidobacteria bacterium AH-259-D05]